VGKTAGDDSCSGQQAAWLLVTSLLVGRGGGAWAGGVDFDVLECWLAGGLAKVAGGWCWLRVARVGGRLDNSN
jgi:hypothetical protein